MIDCPSVNIPTSHQRSQGGDEVREGFSERGCRSLK